MLLSIPLRTTMCMATLGFLGFGQEQKAPQWSVVNIVHVKSGMTANYEAYQKEMSAAYKKAGITRTVVQTVVGNLSEYVSIAPLKKLADLSGDSPIERALGPEAAAALFAKRANLYDDVRRVITMDRPDLSLRAGAPPGMYALVVSIQTMPGRHAEYEAAIKKDMLPALKKVGMTNAWVSESVFGAPGNQQVIVIPLKDTGDLDLGPPLVRAVGPVAAAKIEAHLDSLTQSSEMAIVKVRPDLSNLPDQPAPAKTN